MPIAMKNRAKLFVIYAYVYILYTVTHVMPYLFRNSMQSITIYVYEEVTGVVR